MLSGIKNSTGTIFHALVKDMQECLDVCFSTVYNCGTISSTFVYLHFPCEKKAFQSKPLISCLFFGKFCTGIHIQSHRIIHPLPNNFSLICIIFHSPFSVFIASQSTLRCSFTFISLNLSGKMLLSIL